MRIDLLGWFVALIIAAAFYWKGLKIVRPFWAYRNDGVIQKRGQSRKPIKILYDDREVDQVTSAKILLWNRGKDAVLGDRIPESDPIRFVFPAGIEILKTDVPVKTRESVDFTATSKNLEDGSWSIECSFNFLDRADGVVIEALHTGGRATPIICRGTILGARKGIKRLKTDEASAFQTVLLSSLVFLAIFGLAKLIPESNQVLKSIEHSKYSASFATLTTALAMIASFLFSILLIKWRVPKKIREYYFPNSRSNTKADKTDTE